MPIASLAIGPHINSSPIAQRDGKGRAFSNAAWMNADGRASEPGNPTKRLSGYVLPPYSLTDVAAWEQRASRLVVGSRDYPKLIEARADFADEVHDVLPPRISPASRLQTALPVRRAMGAWRSSYLN